MNIKRMIPMGVISAVKSARDSIYRTISFILSVFPLKVNKIIFSNFNGMGFGDNPKYLAEELSKRGTFQMYWIANDMKTPLPEYITPIKRRSLQSLYHMATAKVWINNVRQDPWYYKRKNQFYLQTWHGTMALKKIEKDAESVLDQTYVKHAVKDSEMIDLMIADSDFTYNQFSNSFWYNGEVKRLGFPRLDGLFLEENVAQIRKKLNISVDGYIVLYAPTFRNNLRMDVYDLDFKAVSKAFENCTGKSVTMLVRMHPNLTWILQKNLYDGALDVTYYPDVYELLLVADALITDYSTMMFEFPIAKKKPVFCYAKDKEEYDRGFYFRLDDLPFSFSKNNTELIQEIEKFDSCKYEQAVSRFYDKHKVYEDGKASERVVDYLMDTVLAGTSKQKKEEI